MPARLAQVLVSRGLLTPERADEALRQLAVAGGALDTTLLEHGWVPEVPLLQALGEASGFRAVNLADFEPNPEVATLIPPKIADRLCVAPLSVEGPVLHIVCGYPVRKVELDEVAFLLGKQLELWVGLEVRIRDWISTIYKQPLAARFTALLAQGEPVPAAEPEAPLAAPLPPPPPTPSAAEVPPRPPANVPVEETTLEDSLSLEMVERLARTVAEEPIPLEVRKKDRSAPTRSPEPVAPEPVAPEPVRRAPEPVRAPEPARAPEVVRAPEPARAPAAARPPEPPPPVAVRPPEPPRTPEPPPRIPAVHGKTPTQPELRVPTAPVRPPPVATPAPVSAPPQRSSSLSPPLPAPAIVPRPSAPALSAALQPTPDVVPDWSIADARAALKVAAASGDRDQVIDVALTYARRTFEFAAAFAVLRGSAVGWDARGQNATKEMIAQVSIPLDATSVFRTVALSRGSFTGPLPPDTLNLHYLSAFGRQPRALFLFPVEVKARLVALVYGDSGTRPFSQRRLSDFLIFCQELPAAFQELILLRKQRVATVSEEVELTVETPATPPAAPSAPAGLGPAPSAAGLGWGPLASSTGGRTGRAASMPALTVMEAERPPPDFTPILRRLTGPDPTERARAMAELARAPEASSRVLATRFPGPTAWSRLPVMELPEADELGPIPGALARLGRPAATALAPLLDSDDSDTRYLALLTAGNLPYAELVDGVLRGLFDLEPDISSAARAAATALRKLPRFDAAMKDLRQELTARDSLRRGLAARALGVLHDREAIDGLVGLTGSEDQLTAQAAAEALREITKQSHGTNPREWLMWWAENRGRRRIEWLVSALRHRELDIRTSAIEELTRTLNDSLGYAPDGATAEREEATQRWEALLAQGGRWQKLEI